MVAFFNPDTGSETSRQLSEMLEVLDGIGMRMTKSHDLPEGYEVRTVVNGVSPGGTNVAMEIAKARLDLLERAEQLLQEYGLRMEDGILVGFSMDFPVMVGQLCLVASATLCTNTNPAAPKQTGTRAQQGVAPSIPRSGSLTERAMALATTRADPAA